MARSVFTREALLSLYPMAGQNGTVANGVSHQINESQRIDYHTTNFLGESGVMRYSITLDHVIGSQK